MYFKYYILCLHDIYVYMCVYVCICVCVCVLKVLSPKFKLLEKRMTPSYSPDPKHKGSFEVPNKT